MAGNTMIQKIIATVKFLFSKPTDEPRKWKCCDKLVKPSEVAQHFKDEHMQVKG